MNFARLGRERAAYEFKAIGSKKVAAKGHFYIKTPVPLSNRSNLPSSGLIYQVFFIEKVDEDGAKALHKCWEKHKHLSDFTLQEIVLFNFDEGPNMLFKKSVPEDEVDDLIEAMLDGREITPIKDLEDFLTQALTLVYSTHLF